MPELPEIEITARRLDDAIRGIAIESARAPGVKVMRTFSPAVADLSGREIVGVSRRGKHLLVTVGGELTLLIHLMSAGRLQLYESRASMRDRTVRIALGLAGGRELRLREFGSRQAAWAKVLSGEGLAHEEALVSLGPEAWPGVARLEAVLETGRPLHSALRDQRLIAGIGRSWADEILWEARLSPYRRGGDLDAEEVERLGRAVSVTLEGAIEHYEAVVRIPIPDSLPMELKVHRREGEPCLRCGETLHAVHFEDRVIAYCPVCQTGGKILKDRRMSRLLK